MSSPENQNSMAITAEMSKESQSSYENREAMEAAFEGLLKISTKVNEGNNGIICKINTKEIPPDLWKEIVGQDVENQDKALKLLKIYKPGEGKKEFEAQQKMYNLISGKSDTAQIPRPWFHNTFDIKNERVKSQLSKLGFNAEQPKVDIIIMDFVPGEELAASFYRNIIRNDKSWLGKERYADQADTSDINKLNRMAAELLKFEDPFDVKAANQTERMQKERAVMNRNAEKLYRRLEKNGYRITQESFDKIINTLRIMHAAGWVHGDLHERNILISDSGETYIIDFGRARKVSDEEDVKARLDSYTGEGENLVLQDGYIIKRLQGLIEKEVLEKDPYQETFGEKLESRLSRKELEHYQEVITKISDEANGWKDYTEALAEIDDLAGTISFDTNVKFIISGALFYHACLKNPELADSLNKALANFSKKEYSNRKLMLKKKLGLEQMQEYHLKQALGLLKNSEK